MHRVDEDCQPPATLTEVFPPKRTALSCLGWSAPQAHGQQMNLGINGSNSWWWSANASSHRSCIEGFETVSTFQRTNNMLKTTMLTPAKCCCQSSALAHRRALAPAGGMAQHLCRVPPTTRAAPAPQMQAPPRIGSGFWIRFRV